MKIILAFLMIILCYVNTEFSDEQTESFKSKFLECREQNNVTDEDIELFNQHKIPESEAGKCFVACLKKSVGVMDEENKVNLPRIAELIEQEKEKEPDKIEILTNIFQICSAEVGADENECEVAAQLMECSVREVKAANLDVSFLYLNTN